MHNFLNGKSAAMMLALSLVNVTAAFAQDDNSSAKEEGNRNVMLNAASANGCLLYTSPSPRDGLLSRMPSSA